LRAGAFALVLSGRVGRSPPHGTNWGNRHTQRPCVAAPLVPTCGLPSLKRAPRPPGQTPPRTQGSPWGSPWCRLRLPGCVQRKRRGDVSPLTACFCRGSGLHSSHGCCTGTQPPSGHTCSGARTAPFLLTGSQPCGAEPFARQSAAVPLSIPIPPPHSVS